MTFYNVLNIVFVLFTGLLLSAIVDLRKRYDKRVFILRVVHKMLWSSLFLCVGFFAAMHAPGIVAAQVLYCIAVVFYNGTIFFFFLFAEIYTEKADSINSFIRAMAILLGGDAVSVLLSIHFSHIIYAVQVEDYDPVLYSFERGPLFFVHYLISVLIVFIGLFRLFSTASRTPKSYKKRYINCALSVLLVLFSNILFHSTSLKLEISGIILPFAMVVMYYYSIVFSPEQFLRESRAAVIDEMLDGILIFDYAGVFRDANKKAKELFKLDGYSDQLIIREWIERHGINTRNPHKIEFVADTLPGAPVVAVNSMPYYEPSSPDVFSGSYVRIHDRTDEIKRNQEEIYNATHDGLTGLLNKDAFLDGSRKFLEDTAELNHLLICTNIWNFKLYNNLFGTEAGDRLLQLIGASLESNITGFDLIGRMEADRFSILMPRDRFDEREFKEAYAKALSQIDHQRYPVKTCIGIYSITVMDEPVSTMYNRALLAAQTIRGSEDMFVSYYDKSVTESLIDEQRHLADIKRGLEMEEFEFFIQPQVTPEGKVLGGEALVRWKHPDRGIVSPYFFIGLMEKHGMIADLDLMIWRKVCKKLRDWKDRGIEQYISVNISNKDFYYLDIYDVFTNLTREFGIDRDRLNLEITESAVMQNEGDQIGLIQRLREAGFTVEMDDFGSGYSSLNMLNKMHVDVLKLDMGFLQKNADITRSRVILQNIEGLAKALNMTTVAEGVETREQADFLKSIGCDIFQGYLFSPPVSVEDYEMKFI